MPPSAIPASGIHYPVDLEHRPAPPSTAQPPSRNSADLLYVHGHLALHALAHRRTDDAEVLSHQSATGRVLDPLVAHPDGGEPVGLPTDEEEPSEVAAMRL